MKQTSSTLNKIATICGLTLGALALSVFADWHGPTDYWYNSGGQIPAPINVGVSSQPSAVQIKSDGLRIDGALAVGGNISAPNISVTGLTDVASMAVSAGIPLLNRLLVSSDGIGTTQWLATSSLGFERDRGPGVKSVAAGTPAGISVVTTPTTAGDKVVVSPDYNLIQKRGYLTGTCGVSGSMYIINSDGSFGCKASGVGVCVYSGRRYTSGAVCQVPRGGCMVGGEEYYLCGTDGTMHYYPYYATDGSNCYSDC